jgi:hypothetical protein
MKQSGKDRDVSYWRRRTRRIERIWSHVEIIPCGKEGVWVDNDVQYSKVKSLRADQSSGMAITVPPTRLGSCRVLGRIDF